MSLYSGPTGRSRTITLNQDFTSSGFVGLFRNTHYEGNGAFLSDNVTALEYYLRDILGNIYKISCNMIPGYYTVNTAGGGTSYYGIGVAATTNIFGNSSNSISYGTQGSYPTSTVWFQSSSSYWFTGTVGGNGSYTITFPTVEYYDIYDFSDSTDPQYDPNAFLTNDGRNFPDYSAEYPGICPGGIADGLEIRGCRFYEIIPSGSIITAQAVVNGVTNSQSYTTTQNLYVLYPVSQNIASNVAGTQGFLNQSANANSTTTFQGSAITGNSSFSQSFTYGSGSTSNNGGLSSSFSGETGGAGMYFVQSLPLTYDIQSKVQSFSSPVSATLDIQTTAVGTYSSYTGNAPFSVNQISTMNPPGVQQGEWSINSGNSSVGGNFPLINQFVPIRTWVDESYLNSTGDQLQDWRCQFLGFHFPSYNLSLATNYNIGNTQTITGSSFNSIALSVTGTQLEFGLYRYLKFDATDSGIIRVVSKDNTEKDYIYSVSNPGSSNTVTIDLCSPYKVTIGGSNVILPRYDARDSYYPLSASGNYPDESTPDIFHKGIYSGALSVSSLLFYSLGSSSVTLSNLQLQQNNSTLSFLPTFYNYQLNQTGSPQLIQQFGILTTDGKLVIDAPSLTHIPGVGWSDFTVTDLMNSFAIFPGVTVTPSSSFIDSYHTNALPAGNTWGGGYTYTTTWNSGVDITSQSLVVNTQDLFDEISGYPGISDPFTGGTSYGSNLDFPLRFSKFLRGRSYGLVLSGAGSGLALQLVQTKEGGTILGSGTSDSEGKYTTESIYGRGGHNITTFISSSSSGSSLTEYYTNRHSFKINFTSTASGFNPYLLTSEWGDWYLGSVSSQIGSIQNSQNPYADLSSLSKIATGEIDSIGLILDAYDSLYAFTVTGSSLNLYISYDNSTFTQQNTLIGKFNNMPVSQITVRANKLGDILLISSVSSGISNLQYSIKHAGDSSFSAPSNIVDNTGTVLQTDGSGFSLEYLQSGGDFWMLAFTKPGDSNAKVWLSSDYGASWFNSGFR